MEKIQKCEVQEQSYVPSPESFKFSKMSRGQHLTDHPVSLPVSTGGSFPG
jgi:hypothetical protein